MKQKNSSAILSRLAESYARLVLAAGEHDRDSVDAFYGPEEWKTEAAKEKLSLEAIKKKALGVSAELKTVPGTRLDEMSRLRHEYLLKQLQALITRVSMLTGTKHLFDEEARLLYDAVAPVHAEEHFQTILKDLSDRLPGKGSVAERYDGYRKAFMIPKEKLEKVFAAAVQESRKRTKKWISLPESESFTVEYVTGKSWSGYNWYKGGSHSLIQINTDLPISIDRAIDLASHEGYPGHHVYNTLIEKHLVQERKWLEFTVYALFSPQSLIAEGSANTGIEMAFPLPERVRFEREVLFPMAGLDGKRAEEYSAVQNIVLRLSHAENEAARKYLDGAIPREETARWLGQYALMSPERAIQRTKFYDQYRSYVINYNLGQDIIRRYLEARGGTLENLPKRWAEFETLLSSPRIPSQLGRHPIGSSRKPYQLS
jgi:hypothetical protein